MTTIKVTREVEETWEVSVAPWTFTTQRIFVIREGANSGHSFNGDWITGMSLRDVPPEVRAEAERLWETIEPRPVEKGADKDADELETLLHNFGRWRVKNEHYAHWDELREAIDNELTALRADRDQWRKRAEEAAQNPEKVTDTWRRTAERIQEELTEARAQLAAETERADLLQKVNHQVATIASERAQLLRAADSAAQTLLNTLRGEL